MVAPLSLRYQVQSGELRKNVPTNTRTTCVETIYRDQFSNPHSRSASFHAPPGAVRHPQMRVDAADRTTSVVAKTRYAGTSDIARTIGRTNGHGGVAQDNAHVQNRKAGRPESPNTSDSMTKMVETAHATRALRAHFALTCELA